MIAKEKFIAATRDFNTLDDHVPAYYFRKAFNCENAQKAKIRIAVCGFYELFFNGARITRGFLSPYVSNPNDLVYYDEYDVSLDTGENVIGFILGNGFQNNPGGHIWDFDKASFRSAPKASLCVAAGDRIILESGADFKVAPSAIRSDDYRFGEHYDANYEIDGWNLKGFDDSAWQNALPATAPKGEIRIADVAPIVKEKEITPVSITPCGDGYIYDFGESNTGICRLRIKGGWGQKIELRHADSLQGNGDLNLGQVWFVRENWEHDKDIVHLDTYVCKGDGEEVYEPTFTYHGFRYVRVNGITPEQATKELLTFLVYHTQLHDQGGFTCSDSVTNMLQDMTRRSIVSNFHHFPTDCPQREKNGWTADAALSSEAALLNFDPERNYREWMRNIRKAQAEDGELPGIVPTDGWGYRCGPSWDSVLLYLPYFTYLYRGETQMITESAQAFLSYLRYLRANADERGLLAVGLGDWCHVGGIEPKSPLIVTDSIMSFNLCNMMADMFDAVSMNQEAALARSEAAKYRASIREHLVNFENMHVKGDCQTSQAMAIFYGVFDEAEKQAAFDEMLEMIHAADDHIDLGVLGGRVIFHVLTEFGNSDLAYKMITREDYPSYGNWIKRGATTLWEAFYPDKADSMNHHFWGDISAWFIKCLAGIRLNPGKHDVNSLEISPSFVKALDSVSAYHIAPAGKIAVSWKRENGAIRLELEIPEEMNAVIRLEKGVAFADGTTVKTAKTGTYTAVFAE